MTFFRTARSAAFTAFLLALPAPAVSALTAEEVWATWQRLATAEGIEISATTRRQGDRLVLTNIVIPIGPPTEIFDVKLGRIDLQERLDGTVAVLLPPQFPVTVDPRETDPDFDFDFAVLSVSAPEFSFLISGIGDTTAFDLKAPSLTLSVEKLVPALRADKKVDLNLALADLVLQHSMELTSGTETSTSSLRLGTMHADLLFVPGIADENFSMSFDLSNVVGETDGFGPSQEKLEAAIASAPGANPLPVLLRILADEGSAGKGELSYGSYALQFEFNGSNEYARAQVSSGSGRAAVKLDGEALAYDVAAEKTAVVAEFNTPDTEHFDLGISIAEFGYGISIGIGDLVTPQEVRVTTRLVDLALSNETWGQFDPTGALGTDPLSYAIDIAAHYALDPEMLDPDWTPNPDVLPPIDFVDATLTELMFSGFGVTLGGSGALTFDESDLTTFDGFPAPEGQVGFQATGVNALLDRLTTSDLIPEHDLSAWRFALAMIAKVGDTPESLVSNLEFRDRAFYLNGMKLR